MMNIDEKIEVGGDFTMNRGKMVLSEGLDLSWTKLGNKPPDPNVVALQFPIGARELFQDGDLPPGTTYAQIEKDLGMSKEVLIEHALLAWPHYVKSVEGAGGSDEEFYERVVEYFYDDIGQEDARLPMEAHQRALSKHASSLVRMVERIDDRLSDYVGGDLFFRQNPPDAATLVKLSDNRCVINVIYPSDHPDRELPFFGRHDGDPGDLLAQFRKTGQQSGKSMIIIDADEQRKLMVENSGAMFSDVLPMMRGAQVATPVREFLDRWSQDVLP